MVKEYHALATSKKRRAPLGLVYSAYGIRVYNDKNSAKKELSKLCRENRLKGKVINLTSLVEMGFISKKHLRILD
jgi:predicted GTPase